MDFAEQIKAAKVASGISFAGIAELIGCPSRTVQDWVYGKRTPPEYVQRLVLAEIARATGGADHEEPQ